MLDHHLSGIPQTRGMLFWMLTYLEETGIDELYFVSAALLGLMWVHKTFECIIKMHIVMYRDWSGNWDFPFLETAGDINAAGLAFPLTEGSRGFPDLHLWEAATILVP